jgi:hypothetical protein
MSKGQDRKKETKKKPAKSLEEKRAAMASGALPVSTGTIRSGSRSRC